MTLDEPASSFGDLLYQYAFTETLTPSPTRRMETASDMATRAPVSSASQNPPSSSSPLKRKEPPAVSPRPSKKKAKGSSSGYAPPSTYAHLTNLLTDSLAPDLICVFIGVNPGIRTATTGHAYSHPSNLFWKLCYSSGCTPRLCKPTEDHDLPHLYALGHTNIVTRPTKNASELSKDEMDEGVAVLNQKIQTFRPESVCIVGKSIWESIWRVKHGKKIGKDEFKYRWQDDEERMGVADGGDEHWRGARVFVATTTSGLAAGMRPHEKAAVWRGLGEFVTRRRVERGIPDEGGKRETVDIAAEESSEA